MPADVSTARLAALAAAFAFVVIVFGAFVRLSNAGLSCPDWPTCYGKATWPGHEHEIERANADFPDRPVESHKAWREQVHRFLAGGLGLLVFALGLRSATSSARWLLIASALAVIGAIALYMRQQGPTSTALSMIAIGLPLLAAWRLPRSLPYRIAVATVAVIIFQAMLGMWTVTLLLKPIVVMGHLLGGMLTFALLAWIALSLAPRGNATPLPRLARMATLAIVLIALQIALGGWTSANYAALACGMDFPKCAGSWWPPMNFSEAFVLWRGIGVDYEGGVLDMPARAAIQMVHRIGALVVFGHVLATAAVAFARGLRAHGAALAVLLAVQVGLGIANVYTLLPLPLAVAHNAGAVLLLLAAMALRVRVGSGIRAA